MPISSKPDWLPDLIRLEDFDENDSKYEAYFNALYDVFKNDFIDSTPSYREKNVGLLSIGTSLGKDNNFWHIVTKKEFNISSLHERPPYIRRCERIKWPRAIIENAPDEHILIWNELDENGINLKVHLWLKDFDYVVVLIDRKSHYLLLTAYYVDSGHYRRNLQKRYDRYK